MQEIMLSEESIPLVNKVQDWPRIARYLESLATGIADSGDYASALQLWQAAEILIKISDRELPAVTTRRLAPSKRITRVLLHEPQAAHVSARTRQSQHKRTASRHAVDLTSRELEVLRLLTQGMTNPQIAHRLIISLHTVNAHVRSIFNKVGVNSRCAVTRYALEQSLL